jgi:hypothetical protein
LIVLLIPTASLFSQEIVYTYYNNGNRHTRTLTVQRQESGSSQLPTISRKSLNTSATETSESKTKGSEVAMTERKISEGSMTTKIYPNPTKGILKIETLNMPLQSKTEMRLYNSSGAELTVIKNFESYYELDISQVKDGLYILRIKINDTVTDWKVVKNTQ